MICHVKYAVNYDTGVPRNFGLGSAQNRKIL